MSLMLASPFAPFVEILGNEELPLAQKIKTAYDQANNNESKLPEWIVKLHGMSGKKYRYFINNLIESIKDPRYLEIGCWKGSTSVSALFGNKIKATLIDNWSQTYGFENIKEDFMTNIQKCITNQTFINVRENDFKNINYNFVIKHNVYFFDGPHEEQDQYDGLSLVLPALDDEFILIVDDWNDPRPQAGTKRAIQELNIDVLYSIEIRTSNGVDVVYPEPHVLQNSDWHNGYYIALCKQQGN